MDTASSPSRPARSIAADAIRSRDNGPDGPTRGLTAPPPVAILLPCERRSLHWWANAVRNDGRCEDVSELWPRAVAMGRAGGADPAGGPHLDGHHDPAHR